MRFYCGESMGVRGFLIMNSLVPLLFTIRIASALGLTSLSLTGEISLTYLAICWGAWLASFGFDRMPQQQNRLRAYEAFAVLGLVATFAVDFFIWDYSIFVCMAHFLLLFQLFKLLGPKTRKDCLQILVFSFFQILSACTLSLDVWHGIILLLLIPTATAGLFWQQISREEEMSGSVLPSVAQKPYRRLAFLMCGAAIPLNLALAIGVFLIFPRFVFRGAFTGLAPNRVGYTEQVNLTQTGSLGADATPVLWLKITPAQDHDRWSGYLRGATLDFFDGRKWSRTGRGPVRSFFADSNGVFRIQSANSFPRRPLRQTVTLLNTTNATVYASPWPVEVVAPLSVLQHYADGSLRWTISWRKPLAYEVLSVDQAAPDSTMESNSIPHPSSPLPSPPLSLRRVRQDGVAERERVQSEGWSRYLQLPALPMDRVKTLTESVGKGRSPLAKARAIETYLHNNFRYSLFMGDRHSASPVEDFLFVTRQGPCGYFASTMAVMLRIKGIPARVVAGYYHGTWNTRAEQFLIREKDAHAWVEAYIDGRGWVRFDPSPRPLPQSMAAQLWLLRAQEYWEFLNYRWNRLVIEYDLYSQMKVVEDIHDRSNRMNAAVSRWLEKPFFNWHSDANSPGESSSAHRGMAWGVGALTFLVVSGVLGIVRALFVRLSLHRRSSIRRDPSIDFYRQFLEKMARAGHPKIASETGWEYVHRLTTVLRSTAKTSQRETAVPVTFDPFDARQLTDRYYRIRFAELKTQP